MIIIDRIYLFFFQLLQIEFKALLILIYNFICMHSRIYLTISKNLSQKINKYRKIKYIKRKQVKRIIKFCKLKNGKYQMFSLFVNFKLSLPEFSYQLQCISIKRITLFSINLPSLAITLQLIICKLRIAVFKDDVLRQKTPVNFRTQLFNYKFIQIQLSGTFGH